MNERNKSNGPRMNENIFFGENFPKKEPSSVNISNLSPSFSNINFTHQENSNNENYADQLSNENSSMSMDENSLRAKKSIKSKSDSKSPKNHGSDFQLKKKLKLKKKSIFHRNSQIKEITPIRRSMDSNESEKKRKEKILIRPLNKNPSKEKNILSQTSNINIKSVSSLASKCSRKKQLLRSYLAFDAISTDTSKTKLPDGIKPNYNIGKFKVVYHEKGYLWGQSKFHFSNYRIQITFWSFIIGLIQFELLQYSYKQYDFFFPEIYYSFYLLFIAYNILLLPDCVFLIKHGGCSKLVGITLVLNILYWLIEFYGFYQKIKGVWIFGFCFMMIDIFLFCYFYSNRNHKIHQTYNGMIETTLSIVRFMLFAKLNDAFRIYWTAALFPLTGFSIFSTFLFLFLTIQELSNCIKKKRKLTDHTGKKYKLIF